MNFMPVNHVKIDDPFWSKKINMIQHIMLPYMWEILNDRVEGAQKSYCIENFKVVAGLSDKQVNGVVFIDSDLYKWIEAVSYSLSIEENLDLANKCDQAIDLIAQAQTDDGYLNTYYQYRSPEKRWSNLMEGHELYCAGHLIEAAVANYLSTGKKKLLKVAQKFANLIDQTFGAGKKRGYPGHSEIELALIRLYEVTQEKRYLSLSKYFVEQRGKGESIFKQEMQQPEHQFIFSEMKKFDEYYFQNHLPVCEQKTAEGHAVRAMYLYSAMADIARLEQDQEMQQTCETLYQNVIERQMYVTGGIGAAKLGERFTTEYDLPRQSAYLETCASIGLMFFSSRMWLLNQEKQNYDIWEQVLYNTVLSGMGNDGKHFFYVNPIEVNPKNIAKNPTLSHVKTQRQKWFGVACCPPNLARIISSMRGYIYALENDHLYILSHIGSIFTKGGLYVKLSRSGDNYTLTIDGDPKQIVLRLPENSTLTSKEYQVNQDGYFRIEHQGGKKDYHYTLKPNIRILKAHPKVESLSEKISVQRGSTVYCLEGIDNHTPLSTLRLPENAKFTEQQSQIFENDMPILKTNAYAISEKKWGNSLYLAQSYVYEPVEITLVPYSQWGNRGETEMKVWLDKK